MVNPLLAFSCVYFIFRTPLVKILAPPLALGIGIYLSEMEEGYGLWRNISDYIFLILVCVWRKMHSIKL